MRFIFYIVPFLFISLSCFGQKRVVTFYFESSLAELKDDQQKKFERFIDTIEPSAHTITEIQSYCDNQGSNEYNVQLAKKRIAHVVSLLAKKEFQPLSTQANGEEKSGESTLPQDLRKWRKVDIHIEPKKQMEEITALAIDSLPSDAPRPSAFDNLTVDYLKSEEAEPVVLNIEFFPGTDALYGDSYAELDKLFQFMRQNEDMKAFIRGHVCCGSDMYLSYSRAYVVYNFLMQRGISLKRIDLKGFDNTMPRVSPELTDEDRQRNRRVDVIFTFPN